MLRYSNGTNNKPLRDQESASHKKTTTEALPVSAQTAVVYATK